MCGSITTSATWACGPGRTLVSYCSCPIFVRLRAQLGDLLVDQLHSGFHRRRRGFLQVGIDRGVDAIALVVHLALVELADQRVAHQVDEVGRVAGLDVRRRQFQRRGLGFFRIRLGDGVSFDHAVQHQVAAFEGALGMPIRRKIAGRLNDSGNQRGFRQGKVFQVFVEVGPRRLGKAADGERTALAQIDAVGIELENLLLAELLLHFERQSASPTTCASPSSAESGRTPGKAAW